MKQLDKNVIPFPYFGAGYGHYYEWAKVNVRFVTKPDNEQKEKIIKQLSEYSGYMNFGEADSNNTDGINGDYIFKPNSINQYYLSSILDLASKNKIAAFLIIAPMNQASFNSYHNSKYDTTVHLYLKTLQDK